jgi:short-subunit dehydrogenase
MKTVLITGANRGLGKALAECFSYNHRRIPRSIEYKLILNARKFDLNKSRWFNFLSSGCAYDFVDGDLLHSDTISKLAANDVDILINNAGVRFAKPFSELSEDEIRETIDTNLMAPILLTKALWTALKKNKGLVVNINSLAGKTGGNGETAYCASKHGLAGFSSALQFDATKDGIRVIDVFVGAMQTNMTKERKDYEKLIYPKDVAETIYSLCKDYASMRITEININRRRY